MIQFITQMERYFDVLGFPLLVVYAAVLILWQTRKRIGAIDRATNRVMDALRLRPGHTTKTVIVVLLSVLAVAAYAFCYFCGKSLTEKASHDATFFHILASFSVRVFPYFIAGCVLSGIIERAFAKNTRWLPKSMISAGMFASLLPICSCAAVPFSYSLMATRRIRLRGVITFMMVVPVLNPFVIVFSYGVLGGAYVAFRILSIFVLAMITGALIERFCGEREPGSPKGACFSCQGCKGGGIGATAPSTAVDAAFNLVIFLVPYMIVGVLIGAAFTVFVPPFMVGQYLSSRFTGMLLAVLIGLPVFLCSGEDVLILAPLMEMGLPMGHGIALTLAGNGICLSSIALLAPLFGKKATAWIVLSFFTGSITIGLVINALWAAF